MVLVCRPCGLAPGPLVPCPHARFVYVDVAAFLSEASSEPKFTGFADEPEKFASLKGLATFLLASEGQR